MTFVAEISLLLKLFKKNTEARIAGRIDINVVTGSYKIGIGNENASIAVKCILHMPKPRIIPPDNSKGKRIDLFVCINRMTLSAQNPAKTATK